MQITFRPFTEQDEAAIISMCLALYIEDSGAYGMNKQKITTTIQHWKEFPDKGSIIVFEIENHLVGYANLIYYWSNEYGGDIIIFDELFVKQEFRNQGIITRFINEFPNLFKRPVCGYELQVHTGNDSAERLYERLGFKKNSNTFMIKLKG